MPNRLLHRAVHMNLLSPPSRMMILEKERRKDSSNALTISQELRRSQCNSRCMRISEPCRETRRYEHVSIVCTEVSPPLKIKGKADTKWSADNLRRHRAGFDTFTACQLYVDQESFKA